MDRHQHTLNAASTLLGICFVVITGLKLGNYNGRTFGDEVAWVAAVAFLTSIFAAFWHIRSEVEGRWQARVADYAFIAGVLLLSTATLIVGFELRGV